MITQLTDWFAMHGYAAYIWPAYGLVFAVLVGNVVAIRRRSERIRHVLHAFVKGL